MNCGTYTECKIKFRVFEHFGVLKISKIFRKKIVFFFSKTSTNPTNNEDLEKYFAIDIAFDLFFVICRKNIVPKIKIRSSGEITS